MNKIYTIGMLAIALAFGVAAMGIETTMMVAHADDDDGGGGGFGHYNRGGNWQCDWQWDSNGHKVCQ